MKRRRFPYWMSVFLLLAVGVASWSFYNIFNQGISDILLFFGIENFYLQNTIIVVLVFVILLLLGYGLKKAFNKIIR